MGLNLFDKSKDTNKDEKINGILDSLKELFEKKIPELEVSKRNSVSSIQRLEEHGKVTTTYRDKLIVERNNLLNNYAKDTIEKGPMFFIYSKNSSNDNAFNLCAYGEETNSSVITIQESELPSGAGVDSVLRLENENYIRDKKATEHISNELQKIINSLLEEQCLELKKNRIEGNNYEVVEVSGNTVLLMNVTQNDGECFEEIDIAKDLLSELKTGDCIKFLNHEYIIVKN